jgi:reverse gyrase
LRHAASGSSKKAVKGKANEKGNKEEKVLVIVESPAKARTIQSFLNEFSKNYVVESSMGHILELASKKEHYSDDFKPKVISENLGISTLKFGVDVFDKFRPYHVLLHGKENVVKKLQALAKDSDRILLATDEDREGEAISWDLVNVLKPTVPYQVFFNLLILLRILIVHFSVQFFMKSQKLPLKSRFVTLAK